jgi:hypothetical protein
MAAEMVEGLLALATRFFPLLTRAASAFLKRPYFHDGKSTETKCKMMEHFVNLSKSQ